MTNVHSKLSPDANGSGRAQLDDATTDVAAQLSALKADFAGLAAAVQTLTNAGASVVKEEAATKLETANKAGEAAAAQVVDGAQAKADAIATYAREKPMLALAAAAGAGLLIGMLTAPRK